jgi:hypothetical protein
VATCANGWGWMHFGNAIGQNNNHRFAKFCELVVRRTIAPVQRKIGPKICAQNGSTALSYQFARLIRLRPQVLLKTTLVLQAKGKSV